MEHYIGDPASQVDHWEQQITMDNCAVAAQCMILNEYVDGGVSQDDLTYFAYSNGVYTPGQGTDPAHVGLMFDAYGIPNHTVENATIKDLAEELQKGNRVIVGVNSSELWDQGPLTEFWNWAKEVFGFDTATSSPADHAVVVTGINVSDPSNPTVIVNDSGHPNGAGMEYPLDRFTDAWANSDFHYVATNEPPPGDVAPSFDVGSLMGIGTTIAATALGVDPFLSELAGDAVELAINHVDWDQLLTSA